MPSSADTPETCAEKFQFPAAALYLLRSLPRPQVLLLRRAPHESLPGIWSFVAGGIEKGEKAWETVLREAHEETGLRPERLYSADLAEHYYDAQQDTMISIPLFVGFVQPDAQVCLNAEHDAYAWLSCAEAQERLPFPGQGERLGLVWKYFIERKPLPYLEIELKVN